MLLFDFMLLSCSMLIVFCFLSFQSSSLMTSHRPEPFSMRAYELHKIGTRSYHFKSTGRIVIRYCNGAFCFNDISSYHGVHWTDIHGNDLRKGGNQMNMRERNAKITFSICIAFCNGCTNRSIFYGYK